MTATFNVPAVVAVLAVTTILIVGIQESASFNLLVVFVKVGTVLIFIVVAGAYLLHHPEVAATNWTPFLPPNQGSFGAFGLSGIARGAAVIFFAYVGFDAVSTAAQEARNPQRDMPFGLLASLGICTVLYIAVAVILTGVVHYSRLDVAAPVAVGIDATGVAWGSLLVKIGRHRRHQHRDAGDAPRGNLACFSPCRGTGSFLPGRAQSTRGSARPGSLRC